MALRLDGTIDVVEEVAQTLTDRYAPPPAWRRPVTIGSVVLVALIALGWLAWAAYEESTPQVQSQLVAVLARAERNAQRVHRHLKQGHPVRMILAAETRIRADLIVMSKRSRSKVEDALLGSTTRRVVLDAHGDVLVVPLLAGDAARER